MTRPPVDVVAPRVSLRRYRAQHRRLDGCTPLRRDLVFGVVYNTARHVCPRWMHRLRVRYEGWRLGWILSKEMGTDNHG